MLKNPIKNNKCILNTCEENIRENRSSLSPPGFQPCWIQVISNACDRFIKTIFIAVIWANFEKEKLPHSLPPDKEFRRAELPVTP